MIRFESRQWALVLGGSSGFGLATARKLARHGMSVCVVHRDRKGSMARDIRIDQHARHNVPKCSAPCC